MSDPTPAIGIAQEIEDGYEQIGRALVGAAMYRVQSQRNEGTGSDLDASMTDVPVNLTATISRGSPNQRLPQGTLCCVCVLQNNSRVCLGDCCRTGTVRESPIHEFQAAPEVESIYADLGRDAIARCVGEASSNQSARLDDAETDTTIDISMTIQVKTQPGGIAQRPTEGKPLIICCACYRQEDGRVVCQGSCC
jgi:hypothetical protein